MSEYYYEILFYFFGLHKKKKKLKKLELFLITIQFNIEEQRRIIMKKKEII